MMVLTLKGRAEGMTGLKRRYVSEGGTSRLIEGVLIKDGEIGPHLHPSGEDCAIVLSGTLTYWISNQETVKVRPGELVCGWENIIHGYRNDEDEPVHLLVLATPEEIGLEYLPDTDQKVIHLPLQERKRSFAESRPAVSSYSTFSYVYVQDKYVESNDTNRFVAFLDVEEKRVYLFDREPVVLELPAGQARWLWRYEAKS